MQRAALFISCIGKGKALGIPVQAQKAIAIIEAIGAIPDAVCGTDYIGRQHHRNASHHAREAITCRG